MNTAAVLAAWNDIKGAERRELMVTHPDLYAALAWLDAHEATRRDMPHLIRRAARR